MSSQVIYESYDPEHYLPYASIVPLRIPKILESYLAHVNVFATTKLHIAIIVHRGKIIAEARNEIASRSNGAASRGSMNYIHAEKNVVRQLGDISKLKGSVMYVMRIGKKFKDSKDYAFKYSQPCPQCTVLLTKCIKSYGLQKVYFTS
jgi:hypothetical protein